jgi:hypothetical protein
MNIRIACVFGLTVAALTIMSAQPARAQKAALDWQTLAEFLPDSIGGFVAGEAKGGSRAGGTQADTGRAASFSSARRNYVRETPEGEQSFIAVTIADGGRSRIELEPFLPMLGYLDPGTTEESIEIRDRRATQIIQYGESDIALGIIYVRLGDRLLVIVQGEGVREVADLQTVAALVDYDGLEKAKGGKR